MAYKAKGWKHSISTRVLELQEVVGGSRRAVMPRRQLAALEGAARLEGYVYTAVDAVTAAEGHGEFPRKDWIHLHG